MPAKTSSASACSVEDQLCFAAYSLSHAFNRRYRLALKSVGLTYPQYLVVLALSELGAPTTTELALALRLDYGTLTPMVKRLAQEKLLARTRSDADERVVRVSLTEKGMALRQRVAGVMAEIMRSTGKPARELAELVKAIDAVRERLDQASDRLEEGRRRPAGSLAPKTAA